MAHLQVIDHTPDKWIGRLTVPPGVTAILIGRASAQGGAHNVTSLLLTATDDLGQQLQRQADDGASGHAVVSFDVPPGHYSVEAIVRNHLAVSRSCRVFVV